MEALFPRAELPLIDLHITVERDQPGSKNNPRFYRTFQFFEKGNLNNPKDEEEAQEKMRTELDRNVGLFKTAIEKKLGELKDVRKKSIEDWVPQLTFWVNSLPS
jgi:hypothetical protein